jgi:sugar lactone lactonase YvrE
VTAPVALLPLTVGPVPGDGAEDVLVGDDGSVYTGTDDGSVFRVREEGRRIDLVGRTGGRPLGLEWLADGRLLVCDAHRGLLALDPGNGSVETLTDRVHGKPIGVCNNAAVHSNGDIYLSDSSQVFPLERWKADLVENTGSGRLIRRAADGSTEVLLERLRFANGVALAADESFVAVAETGGRTVVRRWLAGPKAGTTDHLATDLPGYPDNIARGSDGLIWVTIASPTSALLERLMRSPRPLRRAAWRLPTVVQPKPARTVRLMAFDDDGTLVHDLSADASAYHMATGVREHRGQVWVGSLEESAIAVLDVPTAH